jgi:hypothetical protein
MNDDRLTDCAVADVRPGNFGFDDAVRAMVSRGWMSAGPAPAGVTPPADGIWRFKVLFSDTRGRFVR